MTQGREWQQVGRRIRKFRQERGLSQSQLAGDRLTPAYISLLESGQRQPSSEALQHITDQLQVGLEELLTGRPPELEGQLEVQIQEAKRATDAGEYEVAGSALEKIERQAKRYGLKRTMARATEAEAEVLEHTKGPDRALERYKEAEELWMQEPLHLRYESIAGQARCMHRTGDVRLAIHVLETYLLDLKKEKKSDPLALMRINSVLVDRYFAIGLTDQAAEAAQQALALEQRVDDPDVIASMHLDVARSLLYDGNSDDALASIRKAEELAAMGGWRNRQAKAQIAEGLVLSKKEKYGQARRRFLEALTIIATAPTTSDEVRALNELARVERLSGMTKEAIEHLRTSEGLLTEEDNHDRAFNSREFGLCLLTEDPAEAERLLNQAMDLFRIVDDRREMASTAKVLGDLLASNGRVEEALQVMRSGLEAVEEQPS